MNNIEYSKWLNLGPFYLERGQLGVLDPKLLPVNCDEYDFEYIEDFLNKKGAGNVGCQSTYMFLKQDQNKNFIELRIMPDPPIDFEEYLPETKIEPYDYFQFEIKHPLENSTVKSNLCHSFKITSNKMLVFNATYYAAKKNYAKLKRKQLIKGNSNILHRWEPMGYKDDLLINCDNGFYDVFKLSSEFQKKIIKLKDVSLKLKCCSSIISFIPNKVIKKWNVDWIHCDKCNKLTGGFDGLNKIDKDGNTIDYKCKIENDNDSKDTIHNFFCWVIKPRKNKKKKDLRVGFELDSRENFLINYAKDIEYIGQLKDGIPDGKGQLISKSIIAEGEFKKGLKHGVFRFKNHDGKYWPKFLTYYEGKTINPRSGKIH